MPTLTTLLALIGAVVVGRWAGRVAWGLWLEWADRHEPVSNTMGRAMTKAESQAFWSKE